MKRKAIIGGTGVYNLSSEDQIVPKTVDTPYGKVQVDILKKAGMEIVFLPRHGKGHANLPHQINYRANIKALATLGVDEIFATCLVGSMREEFQVGEVVLVKDFIDFTKNRVSTFFEEERQAKHVEMSEPYCNRLNLDFLNMAKKENLAVKGQGVYVCTEGPRLETGAEIQFYQKIGGDIVGMTTVPECVLAKELGICYASVAVISNWATNMKGKVHFGAQEIKEVMDERKEKLIDVFLSVFLEKNRERDCRCPHSILEL